MKKIITATLIAAACIFTACTKNDAVSETTTSSSSDSVKNTISSGTWVISAYSQKTEDKTNQFGGVIFTFSGNNVLTASKNGAITTGTWNYTPSSIGYYGAAPSKASMTLNLGTASPFNRLSKTWNVASTSENIISLDNPEPAEGEHLVFSKQP